MSARTKDFAEAALRIVARNGLPGLSFRTVAQESGWSVGAVQKAFGTKQDLLQATLEHSQSSVGRAFSREPAQPTLEQWLINLVLATLPLDAERRAAVVVGVAFADRAPFDEDIAASIRGGDEVMRTQLVRLCAWRRAEGELDARLDDDMLVRSILAFSAGLAGQLLYDPRPAADVTALVAAWIAAALAGPGRSRKT